MFKFEIQRFTGEENIAVREKDLQTAMNRVKSKIDEVATTAGSGFKSLAVEGNRVNFYNVPSGEVDSGTTVAGYFDFPEELFLDQAGTTLVDNFTWSATTYPNSTNPNLEGKTVLVLAVKGDKAVPTINYSFVNLEKLIDTYSAADGETAIEINGYKISLKVPANITGKTGIKNALKKTANGLEVDISDKADKVSGATAGNIATLDANGNLVDSGITFATDAQTTAMLDAIFGAAS